MVAAALKKLYSMLMVVAALKSNLLQLYRIFSVSTALRHSG